MQFDKFALRHIGPREEEISKMLTGSRGDSVEELLSQTLPEGIRLKQPFGLRRRSQ
jgi:glycine dehydrogenase